LLSAFLNDGLRQGQFYRRRGLEEDATYDNGLQPFGLGDPCLPIGVRNSEDMVTIKKPSEYRDSGISGRDSGFIGVQTKKDPGAITEKD
jgi:hypothetical protein